jgi:hypothetical protein
VGTGNPGLGKLQLKRASYVMPEIHLRSMSVFLSVFHTIVLASAVGVRGRTGELTFSHGTVKLFVITVLLREILRL